MAYTEGTHVQVKSAENQTVIVCKLTSTTALLVYKATLGTWQASYARVATINGLDVTLGPEKTLPSSKYIDAVTLDSTRVLIFRGYADGGSGSSADARGNILNINGTDITVGASSGSVAGYGLVNPGLALLSSDKVFLTASYFQGSAWIITITGDAMTFSSRKQFDAQYPQPCRVVALSSTSVLVAYRSTTDNKGYVRAFTISGLGITFGARVEYSAGNHVQDNWLTAIDSTHACVLYKDADDSNKGKSKVATVSGLNVTLGSADTFDAAAVSDPTADVSGALQNGAWVRIGYAESDDDGHMKNGAVSGITISWQAGETVHSGTTGAISIEAMDDAGSGVYMYTDEDDGDTKIFAFTDSEFTTTTAPPTTTTTTAAPTTTTAAPTTTSTTTTTAAPTTTSTTTTTAAPTTTSTTTTTAAPTTTSTTTTTAAPTTTSTTTTTAAPTTTSTTTTTAAPTTTSTTTAAPTTTSTTTAAPTTTTTAAPTTTSTTSTTSTTTVAPTTTTAAPTTTTAAPTTTTTAPAAPDWEVGYVTGVINGNEISWRTAQEIIANRTTDIGLDEMCRHQMALAWSDQVLSQVRLLLIGVSPTYKDNILGDGLGGGIITGLAAGGF